MAEVTLTILSKIPVGREVRAVQFSNIWFIVVTEAKSSNRPSGTLTSEVQFWNIYAADVPVLTLDGK